jgi:hypothetical protein
MSKNFQLHSNWISISLELFTFSPWCCEYGEWHANQVGISRTSRLNTLVVSHDSFIYKVLLSYATSIFCQRGLKESFSQRFLHPPTCFHELWPPLTRNIIFYFFRWKSVMRCNFLVHCLKRKWKQQQISMQ